MCGIFGVAYFDNRVVNKETINHCRDVSTMKLRGPDGKGTWISKDNRIGFAHRRLSIIDLSEEAKQPMFNQNNNVVLTYNGEIYNHKEIRKELEKLEKYEWKTDHSDTEVILHAYEEWGINCLKKLRGMFAFAIWDASKNELFLVRDRLGIKPLYYSFISKGIIFSSDINAILAYPEIKREINEDAVFDYLSFLTVPAPNTLFKGIRKLENSTYIKIDKDFQIHQKRYWDMFEKNNHFESATEEDFSKTILKEFQKSVQIHKESDVPIGVFLSGGIDSSLNAILFSEESNTKVQTFTIDFDSITSNYTNESEYAKILSKKIGAKHFVKTVNVEEILQLLPELISYMGEPLADPVSAAQYFVSKLARENNMLVCQVGEGMDELFVGYPGWIKMKKYLELTNIYFPSFIKNIIYKLSSFVYGADSLKTEWLRRYANGNILFWGSNDIFTHYSKKKLFNNRLNHKFVNNDSWNIIKKHYIRYKSNNHETYFYDWMAYLDLNLRFPDLLLPKVDKMGMAVSLEARVPFLDHKVVELSMSIPENIKMKDKHRPKDFLKRNLIGILPSEILNRKKIGFVLPINDWFKDDFKENVIYTVLNFVRKTDIFEITEIKKVLANESKIKIWTLYTLALWWSIYFDEE